MSPEQKKKIGQAIINAIISILTALLASSCTLVAIGRTPFGSLVG